MQIEKINNNKLKVILNIDDLEENNIDLNTFMANSLESQELFLDILDLAEEEFNFKVDNSKLIIECICLSNHIFIFTITKLSNLIEENSENLIFCFNNFDSLFNIFSFIQKSKFIKLYTYNTKFYLIINKDNKLIPLINEFSNYKFTSNKLENILIEHGQKCLLNR